MERNPLLRYRKQNGGGSDKIGFFWQGEDVDIPDAVVYVPRGGVTDINRPVLMIRQYPSECDFGFPGDFVYRQEGVTEQPWSILPDSAMWEYRFVSIEE